MYPPLITSTASDIIAQSISRLKSYNQDKMFEMRDMAIEYYTYSNTKKYIERYFEGSLQKEIPLYTQALTKRLINRISLTYKDAPIRIVDNDLYSEVTHKKDFMMKKFERLHNLLGTIALHVHWCNDKFMYHPIINFVPIFDPSDPMTPVAVTYQIGKTTDDITQSQEDRFMYWSANEHFMFDVDGNRYAPTESNPEMINPYGVLPFAFAQPNNSVDEFWCESGMDIVLANKQIDIAMTMLQHHIRSAGGQFVIEGRVDENEIEVGLNKVVVLEDGNMSNLSPNTDINGIIEGIKFQLQHIFQNHHITFDYGLSGNKSGVALRIENIELLEAREDDVEKFRILEKDVYKIEQQIYNVETNSVFPDDIKIDFAEIEFPIEPQLEQQLWEWKWTHGLADKIDYLQSIDPDGFADINKAIEYLEERSNRIPQSPETNNAPQDQQVGSKLLKALQTPEGE
tara:strand:- start:5569 stop:6936 length:1368 start_codon:yes stop_codon:yes gene_type:complete